jgi:zinc transporter
MKSEDIRVLALQPGLIWGFDFHDGGATPVAAEDLIDAGPRPAGFRWLHFNLADGRTRRWFDFVRPLPASVAELIHSVDLGQRTIFEAGVVGLVLHDLEFEFIEAEPRVGELRIALAPDLMVTARNHPLRSAEEIKRRLEAGVRVHNPEEALDLIFAAMFAVFSRVNADLEAEVQKVEDDLLRDRPTSDTRTFITMRSLMVRMHRLLGGMRATLSRLEDTDEAPPRLVAVAERFVGRLSRLDADLLAIQSQLRLLRDELDLQATQQTNQNLYFLSVLTALLMPATLVTGIFGMNTGGLPWVSAHHGSLLATGLALGSSLAVYLVLRMSGFIRR